MVNKDLRRDLLSEMGVTRQALSQQVARIKSRYGPMTTEFGTYVIAHQKGLDISKYLDEETVNKVRQFRLTVMGVAGPVESSARPYVNREQVTSSANSKFEVSDAILPEWMLNEACKMAKVYQLLYVFENSVRELISRVLRAKHGNDWWNIAVPSKVRSDAQGRIEKERERPWHSRRGAHPIYYTDIDDLTKIVTSNSNWSDFQPILASQDWFKNCIEEIGISRNTIAHHNPLRERDTRRLRGYFEDWEDLLKAKQSVIP